MAKDTIKLAGPDKANIYRVLATKGTMKVRPGELYTERHVEDNLLDHRTKKTIETSIIIPRFDTVEVTNRLFRGTPVA
jgi:hypothetical protein